MGALKLLENLGCRASMGDIRAGIMQRLNGSLVA